MVGVERNAVEIFPNAYEASLGCPVLCIRGDRDLKIRQLNRVGASATFLKHDKCNVTCPHLPFLEPNVELPHIIQFPPCVMAERTLLDHHLRATCPELHAALIQESRHDAVIEDMVLGHEGAAFSEGLSDRWHQSRPCPSSNHKLCTSRRLTYSLDQPQHGCAKFASATRKRRGGRKNSGVCPNTTSARPPFVGEVLTPHALLAWSIR